MAQTARNSKHRFEHGRGCFYDRSFEPLSPTVAYGEPEGWGYEVNARGWLVLYQGRVFASRKADVTNADKDFFTTQASKLMEECKELMCYLPYNPAEYRSLEDWQDAAWAVRTKAEYPD